VIWLAVALLLCGLVAIWLAWLFPPKSFAASCDHDWEYMRPGWWRCRACEIQRPSNGVGGFGP
jgi:hypothetical protein